MKVTLISCTPDAEVLLLFTKQARLGLNVARLEDLQQRATMAAVDSTIRAEIDKELAYMADTIPSSWEFVDYVFVVEGVSRAYTHQQVRTRTGSYAQQSLRVVNKDEFDYIWPRRDIPAKAREALSWAISAIRTAYSEAIAAGASIEDARGILPTNVSTNIVCKFNLRTMAELAASRTGGRTQDEYQDVVNRMCDEVIACHPWSEQFLFPRKRNYFAELEAWAEREFAGDTLRKGPLLKIIDKLRKERP